MQFKFILAFFLSSLIFFSSCEKEDGTSGLFPPAEVLGSAIFTVINCTDAATDPTCSTNFEVLAASQIFLYTSAENREFNDPIYAQKTTGEEGTAEFSGLAGGDYFYIVVYPPDATVSYEGAFSIANGSRSQVRIEFNEE